MRDETQFKARIREALRLAKENGYTQAKVGEEAGVSPQAVGQWPRSGKVSSSNLAVLARLAGKPLDWFYEGPSIDDSSAPRTETTSNVHRAPQPIRYHRYPVIGYGQAGAWTEAVAPYPPGAEPHHETTDYCAKGKAFWLEIKGDSMTAPHGGRPSIAEGTLVLFDTGLEAAPGKLVVAQLADSGEATFKQLIEDGGQRYLKALNPAYPLIPINGNCRILGVAVEAKTRL